MSQITLYIPDETLLALKLTPEQLGHDLMLAAAVKLYSNYPGHLEQGFKTASYAMKPLTRPVVFYALF